MYRITLFTLLMLSTHLSAYAQDLVVLLHGIARSSASMEKIEGHFKAEGYSVLNLNYPSRQQPLEDIVDTIHPTISNMAQTYDQVHFITHSMGGLVTRAYITKYRPQNLGRVVMLSPPNKGSEVADFLHKNSIYKWFYGPAGQQLITEQNAFLPILGTINFELGIIAGTRSLDPISSWIIPSIDDGKVAIERMKIHGMKDYIEIYTTHMFIIRNKDVINQAQYFIEHGVFQHNQN